MPSQQLSPSQLSQELNWRLSRVDPRYFFKELWHIPVVGVGAKRFDLFAYQEEVLDTLHDSDFMIGLKARQIGMTTVVGGYAFWSAFFYDNQPWLAVSKNQDGAIKILRRILYGYDRLPNWLKQRNPVVSRSQTYVEFSNGSSIEAVPSVASTGRGDSVYGAILDEFAFMDYPAEVFAAIQPLVYGKLIIISTANGMGNMFYDTWVDSQQFDSAWRAMFFGWDAVPSRTQEWYEKTKLKFRGQEWLFFQEYPFTAEEAFAKSGRVAFGSDLLADLDFSEPAYWEWLDQEQMFVPTDVPSPTALRLWEEPVVEVDSSWPDVVLRKPNYVIGVDVALGLEHGDYTAVTVWNANVGEQVASMYGHFPIENLHDFLWDLGKWYYWALIIPERNASGIAPIMNLYNMRYPRLYRPKRLASRNQQRSTDFGWATTTQSKPKMVLDMIHALRNGAVQIHDPIFRQEASVFVADGKGSYAATDGKHDDFIMSTLVGWQGVLDVGRFPPIFHMPDNHPVTFDEFFSQGEKSKLSGSPLDAMLVGGQSVLPQPKTAYFLHPKNLVRRRDRS